MVRRFVDFNEVSELVAGFKDDNVDVYQKDPQLQEGDLLRLDVDRDVKLAMVSSVQRKECQEVGFSCFELI